MRQPIMFQVERSQQIEYKTSTGSGPWLKTWVLFQALVHYWKFGPWQILFLAKKILKNLRCIILVAPKTFEAPFCSAHSSSTTCERPPMDENLRQLQIWVGLVRSCTGSLTLKWIVFVGEGETKSGSLICLFIKQLKLIELSEYYCTRN